MAKKVYEETNIANIATAIREKTGSEKTYKTSEMAEGVGEAYEAGRSMGIAEGKKSQYDEFWDNYQDYGNREMYTYAFCVTDGYSPFRKMASWNKETFLPKYPIIPTYGGAIVFNGLEIDNFKEHCEKNGIIIDLSQAPSVGNWYRGLKTKYIQDMSVDKATSISSCFYSCSLLEESPDILNGEMIAEYGSCYSSCVAMTKIPRLWATSVTNYANTFISNRSLTTIEKIEGEIKVSISFSYSPLSVESIENIIEHLYDYTENPKGLVIPSPTPTVTFKASAFNVNSEEWRTQIQTKGWSVTTA